MPKFHRSHPARRRSDERTTEPGQRDDSKIVLTLRYMRSTRSTRAPAHTSFHNRSRVVEKRRLSERGTAIMSSAERIPLMGTLAATDKVMRVQT